MSIANSDSNRSVDVLMFPAGRRNVKYYNSRILSDDNLRRYYTSTIMTTGEDSRGNLILGYKKNSRGKLTEIEFLVGGYYVYLKNGSNSNNQTIAAINAQLGVEDGICCVYVFQDTIYPTGTPTKVTVFNELECEDEGSSFRGLYHGPEIPEGALGITIVVPKDGIGVIDPTLDATEEGDYYKPWFRSTATWAASEYSNKNKIWVDDKYDVPHVCVVMSNKKYWLPLGAVYKTSNTL